MDPGFADLIAPPPGLGLAFAVLWGALWGSFLNVVIYRLPRGLSVVRPASHCPSCGHPVRAWDNIPVLSWLLLGGRCRDCRSRISPRYPLVEALTALLSAALYARFVLQGPEAPYVANLAAYLVFFAFCAALVAVIFIDLDHQIIPNEITFGGMAAGLLASLLLPELVFWENALGLVLGGGLVLTLIVGYAWLRGVQGMGLGDVKLLAMIGAFLGYGSLLFVLLVASLLGLTAALGLGVVRRLTGRSLHLYDPSSLQEDETPPSPTTPLPPAVVDARDAPVAVPGPAVAAPQGEAPSPAAPAPAALPLHRTAIAFGPYLAIAAISYVLVGEELTDWYLRLVGRFALLLAGG